jgi:hypothetical protein
MELTSVSDSHSGSDVDGEKNGACQPAYLRAAFSTPEDDDGGDGDDDDGEEEEEEGTVAAAMLPKPSAADAALL